jgi:hypothetical protein
MSLIRKNAKMKETGKKVKKDFAGDLRNAFNKKVS